MQVVEYIKTLPYTTVAEETYLIAGKISVFTDALLFLFASIEVIFAISS